MMESSLGQCLVAIVMAALAGPVASRPLNSSVAHLPGEPTQVEMRNVDFYVDPEIVLHIHRLRGTIRSKTGGPVMFDDKRSLVIHLTSAEVGLGASDITVLL